MNYIIEAAPELLISIVFVTLLYLLTKEKLSKTARHRILYAYVGGLAVALVLLYQSDTKPVNTLDIQETFASTETTLPEVKDLSPETRSSEESSERLDKLIEEQKDSVSVEKDDTGN
ncbi:MAG: hypothetical protein GJ680_17170 [Alteromonadaceae bacterium]|nr:hypothetical protein [Alteromonadaceae bacterium]